MKAARFYDKGDIRIEDIPEPQVLPGTVGIQVAWCGICGTDLHEYLEGPIFISTDKPDPFLGQKAPVTLGHEFAGVVDETTILTDTETAQADFVGAITDSVTLTDDAGIFTNKG